MDEADEEASYRRQFDSVMQDDDAQHNDDKGSGNYIDAVNGVVREDDENVWSNANASSSSSAAPMTYSAQLLDVLGSDEDENDDNVLGYNIEPDLYTNGAASPTAKDTAADESSLNDDEVGHTAKNKHANTSSFDPSNTSAMTEDASSVSSLSLRPLRPWQFPAPKRLRMLREDGVGGSATSPNVSFDSLSQVTSPSVVSSEDGSRMTTSGGFMALLPYGEPLSHLPRLYAQHQNGGNDTAEGKHTPSQPRAFLRLSRLCILSDKEGSPAVMAVASGIIAVGTLQGKIGLFDRSRGWTGAISVSDPVTALAISSDKTFLAVGTSSGHIYLYDMTKLHAPARHVLPVTLQAIKSGRSEGHLQGSRILHVAFVGTRHTAIVSADDQGLSFYHSLGKILGVSSNDTLRILGRYPDALDALTSSSKRSTILAMSSLPLGPQQHQSDAHNFVALLTPSKLVLVGLKPSARTWYRKLSPDRHSSTTEHERAYGCLAWLPCLKASTNSSATLSSGLVLPTLAFTFGQHLHLVRLHTHGQEIQVREWQSYTTEEPVEAVRWLSHEHLLLYAQRTVRLYDVRRGTCTEHQTFLQPVGQPLRASSLHQVDNVNANANTMVANSVQSHKGQLFVLAENEIVVASLVTFSDRLLNHVSQGDSLGAIRLATRYLQDAQDGGSRIGLPELFDEQKPIISQRLLELMRASTAYAFSEERMKDDLAHSAQGVDRTPFFRSLAQVCAEACLALGNLAFLFDELYDAYSDAGIEAIFADQMENFIIDGRIRTLPIPVVQRLIRFRQRQERFDLAERIIRNVHPASLDLDQCITLCLERRLYDALIYVYTRALHDFVGPLIELMPLIKRQDGDAYRLLSYLSIALIGRTYPDQERLPTSDANVARSTLYAFLFSGRCVLWPSGAGGQLIFTLDHKQESFDEPTYPYLRLFVNFDAEAFLDALDVAFEDAWLDDEQQHEWTRQRIISILHELFDDKEEFSSGVVRVFIAIFIARNAPKYPQFVRLSDKQVNGLIRVLCLSTKVGNRNDDVDDDDQDSHDDLKADRQFAVECLLSAYKPAQTETLLQLFEEAGFSDILRRVYRSEGQWDKLALMMLSQQPEPSVFDELDEVLRRAGKKKVRVRQIVLQALTTLVDVDAEQAAKLIQRRLGGYLNEALHILERSPHRQLDFLSNFVEGPFADRLGLVERSQYISLLCSMRPYDTVRCLDAHAASYFDLDHLVEVTRDEDVLDGLLWAQDRNDNTGEGLKEMAEALSERALILRSDNDDEGQGKIDEWEEREEYTTAREQVQRMCEMATRICAERGQESLWVNLLQILIQLTHDVRTKPRAMTFARGMLQDALSSFVSSTSAEQTSFAALFTKLAPQRNATYGEVRDIADAMMVAYKLRQELLGITNRLFDRDVFAAMHQLTRKRQRGWRPTAVNVRCPGCGLLCIGEASSSTAAQPRFVNGDVPPLGLPDPAFAREMQHEGSIDAQAQLALSQSTLDVPRRLDKGKGVLRDSGDVNDANFSFGGQTHSNGELQQDGNEDYFGSMQTSDPSDTFLATPSIGKQQQLQDVPLLNGIQTPGTSPPPPAPPLFDAVVVCFTGQVWHRRCAPASMLLQTSTPA